MRTRATAAVLLLLACTTACGTSSSAQPDPGQTSKASAKPATEPKADAGPRKLGDVYRWDETYPDVGRLTGTTTVLTYKQPITGITPPDQDGEEWAQVEAQVCAKSDDVGVTQFPWSLAFADGTRVEITGQSGGDFPRPEYPMDAALNPGECVKGKIMFPVPEGERAERVIYAPEGADSAEWRVPKG